MNKLRSPAPFASSVPSRRSRSSVAGSSSQALLTAAVMAAVAAALPAQVPAGLQFAELGKRHLPPDSDPTRAITSGDVDRDGDLDMVVGNYNDQNRLYLNDGTGIFTDATASRMPVDSDRTSSVALGDLDGDGDLDMVLGNEGQNRLYLNDGTGTFTDATASRMPAGIDATSSVALGDVDGDGDLDMVFGNTDRAYGQRNRLYLNNGAAVFRDITPTHMPLGNEPTSSVALGDVDGDGDLDMVLGNFWQNRLYLNDGAGTFTDATASRMPVDGDHTTSVVLGDVDGDGDLDVVIGNRYYLGGSQNRLYLNNGTGAFQDATASTMPAYNDATTSLALGDVDGDGDLDIIFGNLDVSGGGSQNRLYLNNGTGTFADATANRMLAGRDSTLSVSLGDVDGDGDLDMALGNWGRNRLGLNDGAGTFADATPSGIPVDLGGDANAMALGDVDGDGDVDLVVGRNWQNRLYLNDATGRFIDATASRMPVDFDTTSSLALGDVDGDGDLDMVLGNSGQQNLLYLNSGTGTFIEASVGRMPIDLDSTRAVALGDVDGDGDLDIVVGNRALLPRQRGNRLYLNDGAGVFTDATATRMPVSVDPTSSLALGDVDGDGDLDMVIGNGGQNQLYLNSGTGTFTDETATRMPAVSDWTNSVALGDLDGDGDLDLVIGNSSRYAGSDQNRLYLNNAAGTFTDATASRMPVNVDFTTSIVLGDVDGDGDLDIVLGQVERGNRLYLNSGTATFTDATARQMPGYTHWTREVALGDIDGDGDLDVVLGNLGQNRLYTNLQRQLDARYLLRPGQPYVLDVYSRHGRTSLFEVVLPYLSTTRVSIPVPPYGVLGIDLTLPLPPALIPQPAGVCTVTWNVPNVPALAGIELFAQAVVGTSAGHLRLTNVTADVLQR